MLLQFPLQACLHERQVQLEVASELLTHGASVNEFVTWSNEESKAANKSSQPKGRQRFTLLHDAAFCEHVKALQFLLENKADTTLLDDAGEVKAFFCGSLVLC